MKLEEIYSSISPDLRNVLLRLTNEEILNLDHSRLRNISKQDILQVFDTLDYSDYVRHDFYALVVDPPWPYQNQKTGGSMNSGAAQKYSTMKIDELKKLGPMLKDLTLNHPSLLFLWVTTNFQKEAMELVQEWGYEYKTKVYWMKPNTGMGFWFRNRVEELWVCVSKRLEKKITPFRFQFSNVIEEKSSSHSSKPFIRRWVSEAADRSIIAKEPKKKLELFARKTQLDDVRVQVNTEDNKLWVLHGDDIDKRDIHEALMDYYDTVIRGFARMRYYDPWVHDKYDLAYLQNILDNPKNKYKKILMNKLDLALKENSVDNVLEAINSL